jgi:hypothetical protein
MLSRKKAASDAPAGPAVQVERRAAVRIASSQKASCALGRESPRAWGKVRDISVLGIGLLMDREIKPGTRVIIEISNQSGMAPTRLLARVVRCQRESGESWVVGCQFDTSLQEEDLQELT